MRVFGRYLLFQVPEWVAASLVAYAVVHFELVSPTLTLSVLAVFVIKDLVLFPVTRIAYEPGRPHGADALLGARAVAIHDLAPEGYVRIGAESWHARIGSPGVRVPQGATVEVRAVVDLTLIVEPVGTDDPHV